MSASKIARATSLARSRPQYFICVICVVILCAAALIARMMLESRYTDMRNEAERHLTEQVQVRASQLSLLVTTLKNRVRYLGNSDLIRLFTYEAYTASRNRQSDSPDKARNLGSTDSLDVSGNRAATDTADGAAPSENEADLQQQMPVMRKLLANFVRESTVIQASLLVTDQQIYISSLVRPPALSEAQMQGARAVFDSGVMLFLPLYRDEGGRLVSDLLYPVFPPLYVQDKDSHPVGVLLVSSDASGMVRELPAPNPVNGEQWRILQKTGAQLQEISFQKTLSLRPFSRWLESDGLIPFGVRSLPDGTLVYSLAVPVADTPLLLSCEIHQSYVEENYARYKHTLILVVSIAIVCILLIIGMAWWWLLGQREKAVSVELHGLYKKVNAQKQLLDKVNSAIPDGIVLKDLTGKIGYANDAFALIVKQPTEALVGQYHESLITPLTVMQRLHPKSNEVLETGETSVYTETLLLDNERRIFQVLSSPLRSDGVTITDVVLVYRDITDIVKAHEKSQHLTHQMVTVLVRSLETVDPYLSGQSMFTADLAHRIARLLELEFTHVTTVRAAGSLALLGMLQLPAALRTKEGTLTADERAQMRKHVEYTNEMLKGIDFGVPVQEAIYQMYESVDGTGYPKGLYAADICMDARILSVANTFCALMRPRSYRQAHDVQEALRILAGPKFDAQIVATLHTFLLSSEGQDFVKRFAQV